MKSLPRGTSKARGVVLLLQIYEIILENIEKVKSLLVEIVRGENQEKEAAARCFCTKFIAGRCTSVWCTCCCCCCIPGTAYPAPPAAYPAQAPAYGMLHTSL